MTNLALMAFVLPSIALIDHDYNVNDRDRYDVPMKDNNGNTYEAIYAANGDLIESREMSENISTPPNAIAELLKSQYKDWKIVGNKEIIKFYHDHNNSSVEEHFRVTVEKDGVKRSISFNNQQSNY